MVTTERELLKVHGRPGVSPGRARARVEIVERRVLLSAAAAGPTPFDTTTQPPLTANLAAAVAPALQKLRSGASAKIVLLGDSLSVRGDGAYLPYFTADVQSEYGNGGAGYQGFSFQTDGGFNGAETAWA